MICAGGLVLIAAYFLVPATGAKDALYSVVGIAATVCLVIAVRRHPQEQRLGWFLLTAATICFVAGDAVSTLAQQITGTESSSPSIEDVLYLLGYPFLFAGVLRICNLRKRSTARETRADAALVSLGALTLAWHFLLQTYADDDHLSLAGKLVTLAYPVLDIGVLYLIVYAIFRGAARSLANQLIGAAMVVLVVADLAYSELAVHSTYDADSLTNAGFLASYVLFAAGAAVPSAAQPAPAVPTEARHWLPLIGGAMFVPPGLLLFCDSTGADVNVTAIATMSVLLTALAVVRTSWLFDRLRNQAVLLTQRGESLHEAIGAQHALQHDLERQASHDSLTGLANRGLLRSSLVSALERGGPTAILFCDLDGFKEVNDSLGHGVGDQLLVVVAHRLSGAVRDGDLVSRLGGDEFAILLAGADDPTAAVALAERVVAVLHQPMMIGELRIQLTASVGVAFAGPGATPEALLSDADAAMYEAKAAGKNRLAVFEAQMRDRVLHRRAVVNNFDGSLQRGEWHMAYQPQVRLSDGALEGFEALVRWQHPTLGELAPDQFITLAEETGFIVPLGRWILQESCAQAVRWPAPSPVSPLCVSINVSGRQLQEPSLLMDVQAALRSSGLRPEQVILEITESVLVHDPAGIAASLATIRDLGIRIAIDDFGTGYSSLSYLSRLPVDILKIDKSFIDPLTDPTSGGAEFVAIILSLARHLDLVTTAEGVEHRQQYEILEGLRCDSAQGYLVSRPLSRDAALAYAQQHSPAAARPAG